MKRDTVVDQIIVLYIFILFFANVSISCARNIYIPLAGVKIRAYLFREINKYRNIEIYNIIEYII